jgi:hypothetical protein
MKKIALTSMQRAGFQPIDGSRAAVNRQVAFVGTDQASMQTLGRPGTRVKIVVTQ